MKQLLDHASAAPAKSEWAGKLACPLCSAALLPVDHGWRCSNCDTVFSDFNGHVCLRPKTAANPVQIDPARRSWQQTFITSLYSRADRSRAVQSAIRRILSDVSAGEWGLNAGSSSTRIGPQFINLDICCSPQVDVIGTLEALPFRNESFRYVVSQEVFEHIADPNQAAREVFRVLQPQGTFYIQTPFVLGIHGAPHDYWRFTSHGLRLLLEKVGFVVEELEPTMGVGSALYQIAVEFFASIATALSPRLYLPAKGIAALLATPLRAADWVTSRDSAYNRAPAGYYAIARKP